MLYFRNVSEDDYAFLKAREAHILEEVKRDLVYKEGFTLTELVSFGRDKPSFGYNSNKQILGIFFREGEKKIPVLRRLNVRLLSDIKRKGFFAMKDVLEENLEGIK